MKISIIGAGIAGLTTAIALKQKGFSVEIFEASKAFKKAGSGINLAINAMQVYKRLGLDNEIKKHGSYTNSMNITDEKLIPISQIDLKIPETEHQAKTYAIHRAKLHEILLSQLSDTEIHLGKKLKSLKQSAHKIEFSFEDGSTYTSTLLIGADGIHSAVRKNLFEHTQIRSAKQVCWRGIVSIDLDEKFKTELNELWGKGKRFGFVSINAQEAYWYALANYDTNYQKEYVNVNLVDLFSDFHPQVQELISNTNKEDIILNEMIDLKPINKWYSQNTCLVGDSAHATTPNLGQGACQAIESAYVFAQSLANEKMVEDAFNNYENIRKKNALRIVKSSWMIGKISQLNNKTLIFLRNKLFRLMPKKQMQKRSTAIYKLNY